MFGYDFCWNLTCGNSGKSVVDRCFSHKTLLVVDFHLKALHWVRGCSQNQRINHGGIMGIYIYLHGSYIANILYMVHIWIIYGYAFWSWVFQSLGPRLEIGQGVFHGVNATEMPMICAAVVAMIGLWERLLTTGELFHGCLMVVWWWTMLHKALYW